MRRAVVCVSLALAGCPLRGRAPGDQPSWRRGGEGEVERPRFVELVPASPGAARYGEPSPPAPGGALAALVVDAVARAAGELGKPAPQADGRLFAVAADLARVAPDDAPLAYGLIEFALQHAGLIEPSPHLVVIRADVDEPEAIREKLDERLPGILGGNDFVRVGVGSAARDGGDDVVVLALQASAVRIAPVPRALPDGGGLELAGEIAAPYAEPEVFVSRTAGEVEALPVTRVGERGFRARFACGAHRGRQQIEINGADAGGATVLANFPVWCGEAPPDRVIVALGDDDARPLADGADAERRMVELINRDRGRAGLPALAIDPRAVAVARGHSEDMRRTGLVAHISPTTGSAGDRVKRAGIGSPVVLENVARAYGVTEAQEGLMNSPGHRANLLSRDANRIGVGVVLGEEVAGRRELFVTQLFIRVADALDPAAGRRRLLELVRARRPIDEDRGLSEVAQEMAERIARGEAGAQVSADAAGRLRTFGGVYGKVTTLATTASDVEALAPGDAIGDASVLRFGLGLAQGDHPVMGEGAVHMVLLLGHKP